MNKKFLKVISLILSVMMILGCAITASADEGAPETIEVQIRVEGLSSQLLNRKVTARKSSTVKAIIDEAVIGVTYKTDSTEISSVMTEYSVTASKWQFAVDGVIKAESVDAVTVEKDCEIVLFNASPDAVMPSFDASEAASTGRILFEGTDKNGVKAPIADATVNWETSSGEETYKTDAKGYIYLPAEVVTKGNHDVSIQKLNANNVPEVVRFDKGTQIEITELGEAVDNSKSVFVQIYEFIYDILKGVIEVWIFYFGEIAKLFGIGF